MSHAAPAWQKAASVLLTPFWLMALIAVMLLAVLVVNPVRWLVDHLDSVVVRVLLSAALPLVTITISLAIGVKLPEESLLMFPFYYAGLFIVLTVAAYFTQEKES